jgi:hypothetical protein
VYTVHGEIPVESRKEPAGPGYRLAVAAALKFLSSRGVFSWRQVFGTVVGFTRNLLKIPDNSRPRQEF